MRGVNLGNWFVLERWMKPAVFDGTSAGDEYALCEALGTKARAHMEKHRETFITRDDFRWLRDHGIEAIRLPIGYWLFEPDGPFIEGADWVDRALDWAKEFNLKVNIDLHGLPGHQGPEHHSGRSGFDQWRKDPRYLPKSLDLIESLAQRYKDRDCVNMISVVNEPEMHMDGSFLMNFYEKSYERIRKHMSADKVAVVIAAFTEARLPEFHRKVKGENVMTDIHPYPCFIKWEEGKLLDFVSWGLRAEWPHLQKTGPEDLVVGEWSLGVPATFDQEILALPRVEQDLLMRTFAGNQLMCFEQTAAWFFWSYKIESPNKQHEVRWCYRGAVERGWIPDFGGRNG